MKDKSNNAHIKLLCYAKGREYLEKEVKKLDKQKTKISDELLEMDDSNSTVKKRANKRMRLEQIGEDVNFKKQDINDIDELKELEMK